ncbi:hypothetical protein [Cellulomonas endophytica]|uniref:putative acetyltransferase n=1 Tax=Cellulomonas endophytica TaxID=2494735 RepID=UPI001F0C92A9|nr:hypothetical protein [Cellulomonas endophytica]
MLDLPPPPAAGPAGLQEPLDPPEPLGPAGRLVPGTRAVVRRRRPDAAPGEPPLTDVLGDVVRVDADGVVLRTRHGDEVHVPLVDVLRAKPVPPAPPRRAPRTAPPDAPSA